MQNQIGHPKLAFTFSRLKSKPRARRKFHSLSRHHKSIESVQTTYKKAIIDLITQH